MEHEEYMQLAIEKAQEGIKKGQTPFGAILVRNDEVIVRAHNAVWSKNDITAHAEIEAIRKACRRLETIDLSDTIIYSTCEPCPMCFSAIHWARIPTIVSGARIEDAERAGFNELNISNQQLKSLGDLSVEVIPDVLRDECYELFLRWKEKPDVQVY